VIHSVSMAKRYLALAPASAPSYWTDTKPLERPRMEYEDEIAGGFLKWFPGIDLTGKDVFDIGSGYGGRAAHFREIGARSVIGLEISETMVREANTFVAAKHLSDVSFVVGFGENLPFRDNHFDVITSYDVFEHVADLAKTLEECHRVLRPGGRLYAVFPPFHHPTGAHLDSWLSRMPWANVLFRPNAIVRAACELLDERGDIYRPTPMRPHDKLWMLNGATIAGVSRLLKQKRYNASLRLAPLFSRMNSKWEPWMMKYYAFAFAPLRFVPALREMFTHRMLVQLTK
jgi:SAM-dependent methyltransferase